MKFISAIFFLLVFLPAFAGEKDSLEEKSKIDEKKLGILIATESAFYIGGMSYLQFIWYKDHNMVPFEFYKDGKGYLQVDKFGHAYGSYLESYITYKWMRSAGVSKKHSLLFGATSGFILQLPIEVFDGLYEGWGFSNGDLLANGLGSALVAGQELAFDDQLIKYKLTYWRSEYAKQSFGYLGSNNLQSLFADYNSHTYWLSLPLNKLILKDKLPGWLCISAGYSANGMFGEFENRTFYRGNRLPDTERYRQFLFSLDIDWTKIKTKNRFLKSVFQGMFMIKLPAPALEINGLGKVKGYWMYY